MRARSTLLTTSTLCAVLAACSSDRPTAVSVPEAASLASKEVTTTGFVTAEPAQAEATLPQVTVTPIISSGDIIPGTTDAWGPTPDGLGVFAEYGSVYVFANHELSSSGVKSINGGPTIAYARVSKLQLDPGSISVLGGTYVEDGSTQLQRLCSASWVDGVEGLPTGYFLTGEETLGTANGSVVTAIDRNGNKTPLPHLGAFAHENQIVVPGFNGKVVGIGLDDAGGASELYMYIADAEAGFIRGTGKLYVFTAKEQTSQGTNYHSGNMTQGQVIDGRFMEIADPADLGTAPTQRSANLQAKVDALGAMPFVRIEDGDWDKNSKATPAIYFVDTGNSAVTGRPQVNADCFGVCDLAGSIYRMEFNPNNPTSAKLILLERSKGAASGWASPDNIAASRKSLMLQEDPAYDGFDGSRPPAIWNLKLASNGTKLMPAVKVAQATQETLIPGPTGKCVDALGQCWETSGIVNTNREFGEGSWLFVVQAHTLPFSINQGGTVNRYGNEGGQLLLMRYPGS